MILPALFALLALTGTDVLRLAAESEKQQEQLRARYLYREHVANFDLDKDGKPQGDPDTRDYEILYLEGAPYRRLIAHNGKPLSAKEARNVEAEMRRAADERRRTPRAEGHLHRVYTIRLGTLDDMVRLMNNTLLREEEVNGRKAWVVQSAPPGFTNGVGPDDARLLCYSHVFWIDQEDKVIARHDFEVVREGVDTRPGTRTTTIYASENGSPWFLRSRDIAFTVKPFGIKTVRGLQQHRFTDFKRFEAESKIEFKPGTVPEP